jgi:hypothetical protein
MEWLARLAGDLADEGALAELDAATGQVVIHGLDSDEVWEPPVRLAITEEQLGTHLERLSDDAVDVFPDVAPLQAAYQLFLVHVDETLATEVVPGSEIRLEDGGLQASPEREFSVDIPEGTGRLLYVSPEQYRALHRNPFLRIWVRTTGRYPLRARLWRRLWRRR